MVAFDEHWWDVRTAHHGNFDTGGLATDGTTYVAWIRWRLIDELLRRYYIDFGLEPGFGLMGTELYNVALISPTCRRAPRYFGRLCGIDVHPEDDGELVSSLDGLPLVWAGGGGQTLGEGSWTTWSQYRHAAIRALALASAGVTGHEVCFHRRGKALTPLMYRVALLLRTDGGYDLAPGDDAMLTVGNWLNGQHSDEMRRIIDVIRGCGGTVPPGPPRYVGVQSEIYGWFALRTDGWIATPVGPIDAAGLWRGGASEEEIAAAVHHICMA